MQLNAPAVFYNERTEEYHTVYNYHFIEEPPIYWSTDYRDYFGGAVVMRGSRWFTDEENVICGPLVTENDINKVIINADEWILVSLGDTVFHNAIPESNEDYIEEWRRLMQE